MGVFASVKTVFVPLIVPLGVSSSIKFAVMSPELKELTVLLRLETVPVRLAISEFNPVVTSLMEDNDESIALRSVDKPVTSSIVIVPVDVVPPPDPAGLPLTRI